DFAVEPEYLRLQHAAIALLDLAALTGHALATYRFQEQPGDAHQPAAYPRQLDIFQRAPGIIPTDACAEGDFSTPLIWSSRASKQQSCRCWQPISASAFAGTPRHSPSSSRSSGTSRQPSARSGAMSRMRAYSAGLSRTCTSPCSPGMPASASSASASNWAGLRVSSQRMT